MNHLNVILPFSPKYCWFATKSDMPLLENPGLRLGTQPLRGYDMAVALERVATKIRAEEFHKKSDEGETYYEILVDVHDLSLSATEKEIIEQTWFSQADCIGADPWGRGDVEGGRHRLWACFDGKPDVELPIYSFFLVEHLLYGLKEELPDPEIQIARSLVASRALEKLDSEFWGRNPWLHGALSQKTALAEGQRIELGTEAYQNLVNLEVHQRYPFLKYETVNNTFLQQSYRKSWWDNFVERVGRYFSR